MQHVQLRAYTNQIAVGLKQTLGEHLMKETLTSCEEELLTVTLEFGLDFEFGLGLTLGLDLG